jgi:hypothetical protein
MSSLDFAPFSFFLQDLLLKIVITYRKEQIAGHIGMGKRIAPG